MSTYLGHSVFSNAKPPSTDIPTYAPSSKDISSVGRPLRILVVDNIESDNRAFPRMLESLEMANVLPRLDIRSESSMHNALRSYFTFRPDCILLAFRCPGINGLEILKSVQSIEGQLSSAVVMMLDDGDENVVGRAMEMGVHDYLIRGHVTAEQLGWTIYGALERVHLQKKLEEQHEELVLFAGSAARDIVGPLNNLSIYLEFAQEQLMGRSNESVNSFDSMLSTVNHLTAVVNGLSVYAQVGHSNSSFDRVYLQDLMESVLLVLDRELQEVNVTISCENLPVVYGDRIGLGQLLENLLANAIKFRRGEVLNIEIHAHDEGEYYHFGIKDNGIGIDPLYHSEIFAPFKRLHSRAEYSGCGLGLATCVKVIEQHQGEIWIDSAQNNGTTVHFTLPKMPATGYYSRISPDSKTSDLGRLPSENLHRSRDLGRTTRDPLALDVPMHSTQLEHQCVEIAR